MDNLLYYPYINVPRTDWTIRTLLYYETIGSIVPQTFFYEPNNYEPFMRELVQNELVIPINPMEVLDRPYELSRPFIDYSNSKEFKLHTRLRSFERGRFGRINENKFRPNGPRINVNKFDNEIFNHLEEIGLARRENHEWFIVEQRTANELMTYLATIIGKKLDYLPATDKFFKSHTRATMSKKIFISRQREQQKRETILTQLIPFPEKIDLVQLRRFKEKHRDILNAFKTKVELIALNSTIEEESPLFIETIKDLEHSKLELSAKMGESKFGQVFFGTVCGIISSSIGLATAGTDGAIIGGATALAGAIYAVTQIENNADIPNQNGMKYLALLDKKLSKARR
ncbi:kinase [Flavobacteriaceae bacterium F89]|uniref:Kinase n=1 Tax=Cerina litoralis TaxID=2874477 RepID=A0AAE3ESS4_9FLAO|nr:kinase [Cerina litoralis]MCG2459474.1 kinase [Cerina litoralis]